MSTLPPEKRLVFNAALQPPSGYKLARLIGTTFSLDMLSALVIPISVEARAALSRADAPQNEVMMLAALKRAASKISIFVEAGNITPFSRAAARLSALMEGCIHQVLPPKNCSFHPKMWVMHFASNHADMPDRTRLIIMSRNLTQDRSWDVALTLDGICGDAKAAHDNTALCDFVRYLLKHAPSRNAQDAGLLKALEKTAWELPTGFSRFDFTAHYPGEEAQWTVGRYDQLAVVSPFCTEEGLKALRRTGNGELYLVSNDDWLAKLPDECRPGRCMILSPDAMPEADGEAESAAETAETASGLHAKIYMAQDRTKTRLTIASGNATGPGLAYDPKAPDGRRKKANIEVFATLTGSTTRCGGIGLDEEQGLLGKLGWGKFLTDWKPRTPTAAEQDTARIDQEFWGLRQAVCAAAPKLNCQVREDGRYQLWLALTTPVNFSLNFSDITVGLATTHRRIEWSSGRIDLGAYALPHLSVFLCIEALHISGEKRGFVLKCDSENYPSTEDRFDAVLGEVVRDADSFLRLAAALLDPELSLTSAIERQASQKGSTAAGYTNSKPLLESMLDAYLAQDSSDRIHALTDILRRVELHHPDWMTPEFKTLWRAFQDATPKRRAK